MRRSLLKKNASLLDWLARAFDPLIVVAAGAIAYRLYLNSWDLPDRYVLAMWGAALACFALFPILDIYAPQRGVTLFEEVRRLANGWFLLAALWFAFLFLAKTGDAFSRVWSLYWIAISVAGHVAFRGSIRAALRVARRRGYNRRHIVIVGAVELGHEIVKRLARAPWSGLTVLGFYDDDPDLAGRQFAGLPVLGSVARMLDNLDTAQIDQVWIALPLRAEEQVRALLEGLRQHSVDVRFIPDIYNFTMLNHSMTEIAGLPVINLTESPLHGGNRIVKGAMDFVLAVVGLIVSSPVMLLIALGIKLSSPGPVLYRQERVTWNGRRFTMLKFRTMPTDAEAESGPEWSRSAKRRATPFGAFIRRTSLDELPQLANVLLGEMSLVGPRPERPEFVEQFRQVVPGYMQKHLVKAGITGWAQVNDLRGDSDLARRIEYDLFYIDNWSIWFDVRILSLTFWHILTSRNAG